MNWLYPWMKEVINVFKRDNKATIPKRNLKSDAGIDIFSIENCFIKKGSTALVKTGISVEVPVGFVGLVMDRSSLALKGLKVGGGVIDSLYSGEISILLHNLNNTDHTDNVSNQGYQIEVGQKIGQLLLIPCALPDVEQVNKLWISERGDNGFGSSGK